MAISTQDNANGLAAFVTAKIPALSGIDALKPNADGYFPAGAICNAFRKEFKQWKRLYTDKASTERKCTIECILEHISNENGKFVYFPANKYTHAPYGHLFQTNPKHSQIKLNRHSCVP